MRTERPNHNNRRVYGHRQDEITNARGVTGRVVVVEKPNKYKYLYIYNV
jgi:hypothetical protein